MISTDVQLIAELRVDEGVRYSPYKDSVGILTVGVGHNLAVSLLPPGYTYPLTDAQVDIVLANDLRRVLVGLADSLPWYATQSYARQRVMANMAFNMGVQGLLQFKQMLAAMQAGNYTLAAAQMADSKWAKQVGARATRLQTLMIKG